MSGDVAELERDVEALPNGWANVCVADALAKKRGATVTKLQTSDYLDQGVLPIVDQGAKFICGYTDDLTAEYPYNLPVTVFGDHTRTLKYVDFPFAVGADGTQCLHPKADFDDRFFFYSLQNIDLRSEGYARHFKLLKEQSIARPPLDEQRRIAEVLRSVDEAIAAADGVAQQWAKTFEALLDAAFAEGESANLGDICSLIYRYPGFYGFEQLETGVPVIRGEHLRAGRISRDWADFYFVDPAFSARFPKTILELDDVVMSVRGTVGTTAVVDAAHVGSQISPNLIRLVADPAKIVPPLLYYAVQSAVAHMRRTIVNAQALPAINAGDLKQVEIALPPLADQAALLAELNGAAAARADAVSAAQQARQTKAVLMSDLLSGRVRVPT